MSGTRGRVALGVVLALAALFPSSGAAGDTRDERERVRREQAAIAAELDVLAAQDEEIAAALESLAANIVAEAAALESARAEVARTEVVLAEARAAEDRLEDEIAEREDQVERLAVAAYVNSGTAEPIGIVLDAGSPLEMSHRATLADSGAAQLRNALDALEEARRQQAQARRDAVRAADAAADLRAEIEGRLVALQTAETQHAALAAEVDARIEARLSEGAALAAVDAELSREILREEVELVARTGLGGGGPGAGPLPAPPLRRVHGITVHEEWADELEALMDAAIADGIHLGGGGYRDSAAQWSLRVAHCPDPANSPASDCSPPTARVGASMHERGLAVDFTCDGGGAIGSHDSPCFQWLAEHGEDYGFYNLPSEPWHWSANGS